MQWAQLHPPHPLCLRPSRPYVYGKVDLQGYTVFPLFFFYQQEMLGFIAHNLCLDHRSEKNITNFRLKSAIYGTMRDNIKLHRCVHVKTHHFDERLIYAYMYFIRERIRWVATSTTQEYWLYIGLLSDRYRLNRQLWYNDLSRYLCWNVNKIWSFQ